MVFLSINIRTKDGVGDAGGNKDEDYDGGEDCQAGRDPREGVLAPIHPITRTASSYYYYCCCCRISLHNYDDGDDGIGKPADTKIGKVLRGVVHLHTKY